VRLDQFKNLELLVERAGLLGEIGNVRLEQAVQNREEKLLLGLEVVED
jgi:hypothetical protein